LTFQISGISMRRASRFVDACHVVSPASHSCGSALKGRHVTPFNQSLCGSVPKRSTTRPALERSLIANTNRQYASSQRNLLYFDVQSNERSVCWLDEELHQSRSQRFLLSPKRYFLTSRSETFLNAPSLTRSHPTERKASREVESNGR